MKYLFSAGFVLFRIQHGEHYYLLLNYPHGHWDFPKGKIEKGETKQQAAIRELAEETELTATIIDGFERNFDYFFKSEGQLTKKTVYYFIAQTTQQRVTLSYEHIGSAWLPYDQAFEKLTYDNAKELLHAAHQFLLKERI